MNITKTNIFPNFKAIADWTIPPNIQKIVFNKIAIPMKGAINFNYKEQEILSKNHIFKDRHKGKRCFIIATGPSIKTQNLKLLQNEICIAVSSFYLHPDFQTISPQYYCVPGFCSNSTELFWDEWMDALQTHASQKTTFFFSLSDKERCTRHKRFEDREIHFLDFSGSFEHSTLKDIDLARAVPGPQSVPVMALEIALYMGFSEIYLLGCDHDWILHMYESRHFYDEKQSIMHNHQIDEWKDVNFENNLIGYLNLWNQYKNIKKIAKLQHTQIYNATNGGFLDVFPRSNYESLFK